MGIIIAKFRKCRSTAEVLTKLENEIGSIEEFQTKTRQAQRKIVFRFIILAVVVYTSLALLLYFQFSEISKNQKLLWSIPLITCPVVIILIKKFLSWYYNRKIRKNERKLVTLKERKKKILENVMETETYKVAKDILDKFGNELKPSSPIRQVQASTPLHASNRKQLQSVLRQRTVPTLNTSALFGGRSDTSELRQQLALPTPVNDRTVNAIRPRSVLALTPAGPALPRGILPPERSVLDKIVEYLVGDGPSNRYALICTKCNYHNGMALKEEFEYLAFRCCYCNTMNPARKMRPAGPKVDSPLMLTSSEAYNRDESSSSERNSESDSDLEPIVEEPRSDSPGTSVTEGQSVSDPELQNRESQNADTQNNSQSTADVTEVKDSGDAEDTFNTSNK